MTQTPEPEPTVDLRIYDGQAVDPAQLLHDTRRNPTWRRNPKCSMAW